MQMLQMWTLRLAINQNISKNSSTKHRRNGRNIEFISAWKVEGALVSPNDITRNSKCHWWVRNAVMWMLWGSIGICWYSVQRSSFVKNWAPCNSSNSSSIIGMRTYLWFYLRLAHDNRYIISKNHRFFYQQHMWWERGMTGGIRPFPNFSHTAVRFHPYEHEGTCRVARQPDLSLAPKWCNTWSFKKVAVR